MSDCESIQQTIRSERTEFDRLIERDDTFQRRVAHDGHKVATDRQQDEGDIDMQDKGGRTGDDKSRTEEGASCRTSSESVVTYAGLHTNAYRKCIWLFRGMGSGSCQSSAMIRHAPVGTLTAELVLQAPNTVSTNQDDRPVSTYLDDPDAEDDQLQQNPDGSKKGNQACLPRGEVSMLHERSSRTQDSI